MSAARFPKVKKRGFQPPCKDGPRSNPSEDTVTGPNVSISRNKLQRSVPAPTWPRSFTNVAALNKRDAALEDAKKFPDDVEATPKKRPRKKAKPAKSLDDLIQHEATASRQSYASDKSPLNGLNAGEIEQTPLRSGLSSSHDDKVDSSVNTTPASKLVVDVSPRLLYTNCNQLNGYMSRLCSTLGHILFVAIGTVEKIRIPRQENEPIEFVMGDDSGKISCVHWTCGAPTATLVMAQRDRTKSLKMIGRLQPWKPDKFVVLHIREATKLDSMFRFKLINCGQKTLL